MVNVGVCFFNSTLVLDQKRQLLAISEILSKHSQTVCKCMMYNNLLFISTRFPRRVGIIKFQTKEEKKNLVEPLLDRNKNPAFTRNGFLTNFAHLRSHRPARDSNIHLVSPLWKDSIHGVGYSPKKASSIASTHSLFSFSLLAAKSQVFIAP